MGACRETPIPRPALAPTPVQTKLTAAPPFEWNLPPGIPTPLVPRDNPMSPARIDLGRRLFYDNRLSGNLTYSCGSCHQQAHAFTDGKAHAIGSTNALHPRSSMNLTNVAFNATFGWADPALHSLEAQVSVPMFNEHPVELGLKGHETELVTRFSSQAADVERFRNAFPDESSPVTFANIVKAIATFERTIISGDTPLDHFLYRDDQTALSASARRGMDLFFSKRLACSECHSGFNLSGPVLFEGSDLAASLFHNTGLYNVDGKGSYPAIDRGLISKTRKGKDMGRFRAPTLRNIEVTAPYMHDGSIATLEEVIAHYARGGVKSPLKSERLKGFQISPGETADLVEFLKSLTDRSFLTNPALAPPEGH